MNEYLIRELPNIVPTVKSKGIASLNELIFGMIMIRHLDGSYTEYYPQLSYNLWRHYVNAAEMYDCWMIPDYKESERDAQFRWRLEYLIKTRYSLGQARFADELGVTQGTISNYTYGKRKPDYGTLVRMASIISDKNRDYSSLDIIGFLLSVYVDPYIQQEYNLYLSEHC